MDGISGDVEEELPSKMLEPRGRSVIIYLFVDANHSGDDMTRHSHNGIIMFVQNAPIVWFVNKQNTAEAATFGSKLVAHRICKDLIVALRYKLRVFRVILEGSAFIFCDNPGVVMNMNILESVLHHKHNAINYN